MAFTRYDEFGSTEPVLAFHLHQEQEVLKNCFLNKKWYPEEFHSYLEATDDWKIIIDPATAAIMQFYVRVSLHGRLRNFFPDLILYNQREGFIIAIEIETKCTWQSVAQSIIYGGLSAYAFIHLLPPARLNSVMLQAIAPFVIFMNAPPKISESFRSYYFKEVDLLNQTADNFLSFPEQSPIGILQILINQEDTELLYQAVTSSDLNALNKIFIVQNILVHGSDVMRHAVEELEHKGVLDIKELEKEAVPQLPPQYMRYFTPEQLRGLTPEQLRGLTPEQLRGLTPEQLRGLTPEQLRSLTTEQLQGLTLKQRFFVIKQLLDDPEEFERLIKLFSDEELRKLQKLLKKAVTGDE